MSNDREPRGDQPTEPDRDVPTSSEPARPEAPDPADIVPVPAAMSPAEIDERAQVVEKLRREREVDEGDSRREP
jgi:hypothetical protein